MKSSTINLLLIISLLEISRADHQRMKRSASVITDICSIQPCCSVLLLWVIKYIVTAQLTSLTMGALFLIKPGILLYLAFYSKLGCVESQSLATTLTDFYTRTQDRLIISPLQLSLSNTRTTIAALSNEVLIGPRSSWRQQKHAKENGESSARGQILPQSRQFHKKIISRDTLIKEWCWSEV